MSLVTRYAAVTPARDEAVNLRRLANCLAQQTLTPTRWIIVENGSVDDTLDVAQDLATQHSWIDVLQIPGEKRAVRGRGVVRALHAGIDALDDSTEIVVCLDADVTMDADYFERLVARFAEDERLGIASGGGHERHRGEWRQRYLTGSTVWGATRAYRRTCLNEVLPFEERVGWDGIDEFKANARGWSTRTFVDIPFLHHRREAARDLNRLRSRVEQGRGAHYVGYRFWYLVLRAVFLARRDIAALGMIFGYLESVISRASQLDDAHARAYVRGQQTFRALPVRVKEVLGPK